MFHFKKHIYLRMGYRTEVGRIRDHNEDNLAWFEPKNQSEMDEKGWFFVVADGMGGYAAGEVASKLAVDVAVHCYEAGKLPVENILREAVMEANLEIFRRNQSGSGMGMGTTIVCAAIVNKKLYLAHVGDSRAYLLRKRKLTLLTRDHSLVNDLVQADAITPEEAQTHPQRHVLSRALGKKLEVVPEIGEPLSLEKNDLLLLCTDGISGYLDDDQISYLLQANADDPQSAVNALIHNVDTIGGEDNATDIAVLIE